VNNKHLWRKWDKDGNGEIDFNELMDPMNGFLSYVKSRFPRKGRRLIPDIKINKREWFLYFDEDRNGSLSQEEILRAFIQTFHLSENFYYLLTMREVLANIWPIFDDDCSGEIDINEFIRTNGLGDTIIAQITLARN